MLREFGRLGEFDIHLGYAPAPAESIRAALERAGCKLRSTRSDVWHVTCPVLPGEASSTSA